MDNASAQFLRAACVPVNADHKSGDLAEARQILSNYPEAAGANIHTAAALGDGSLVRSFLAADPADATRKDGPHGWDALTYLCFSRYLRLDQARAEGFVLAAEALLDAGADANGGWLEAADPFTGRRVRESVIYGAAGIAQHAGLTQLLLDRGADPNDEETPYHVPEGYDHTMLKILLNSGKLNEESLSWMLVRKADWHDLEGLRLVLAGGGNPNLMTHWGVTALHQAVRRDNGLEAVALLLAHGADPQPKSNVAGKSAADIAARRGRGDVLTLFAHRGFRYEAVEAIDGLIAACAVGDGGAAELMARQEPALLSKLIAEGGTVLAEFAGNDNVEGLRCLIDLGVSPAALYAHGDGYFDIAHSSTALHVAAWRGRHAAVRELIARGTPVDSLDGKGRTALALAVKACVDSYWANRRLPDSVAALLEAGASVEGVAIPCGYQDLDQLFGHYMQASRL